MHVCVVAKWRKIFLWSWWRNIVNLQKNSGDEATYTFVSGLPCSESLDSAGGDHFEGLNPHCNGIWICEIVHFDTWRGLFAGWLWYMSNLTARFEWWMWGHRDYPCLCTWDGRGLHRHSRQLSRAACGAPSWSCSQKVWSSVMFPHISRFTLNPLFHGDVVLFTSGISTVGWEKLLDHHHCSNPWDVHRTIEVGKYVCRLLLHCTMKVWLSSFHSHFPR